jgi:hypothetical protein
MPPGHVRGLKPTSAILKQGGLEVVPAAFWAVTSEWPTTRSRPHYGQITLLFDLFWNEFIAALADDFLSVWPEGLDWRDFGPLHLSPSLVYC